MMDRRLEKNPSLKVQKLQERNQVQMMSHLLRLPMLAARKILHLVMLVIVSQRLPLMSLPLEMRQQRGIQLLEILHRLQEDLITHRKQALGPLLLLW